MTTQMERPSEVLPGRFRPYPEHKDSGVEWLGKIPVHWQPLRLRWTVTGCQNGVWGDEPDGLNDLVCVRVADFDRMAFRVNLAAPTLRAVKLSDARGRLLRPGDLLLEKSGGGDNQPVGTVVLYGHDVPAVCSNFIARMRVAEGFDPTFLCYLHNALYVARVNTRSIKQSTGIQNLHSYSYLNEVAYFPDCREQRAIAAFLDLETAKIDAVIARKQRLIELLQEQRASLITQAVTNGLDPNVPMKESGVQWLGKIPVHWQVKKLSWITTCLDGRRVPLNAEERSTMQGDYPYWGANSIVDYVDSWLFDRDLVLLGEDGAPFFDRFKPVAFHVSGKIWVNNHAHVLCPVRGLDPGFLAHALNCVDYRTFIDGSTRDKLTQGDMNMIPIQYPPFEEQTRIREFIDREVEYIDRLITKVHDGIKRLNEFRTALITAAVTGKIDVREEVV